VGERGEEGGGVGSGILLQHGAVCQHPYLYIAAVTSRRDNRGCPIEDM
jgi:hypothetical protein